MEAQGWHQRAREKGNADTEVCLNVRQTAQFKRRYPELPVGSNLRAIAKRYAFTRGYTSGWSVIVYQIIRISDDDKQLLINDGKNTVYNRWGLLKVAGVEGKDG